VREWQSGAEGSRTLDLLATQLVVPPEMKTFLPSADAKDGHHACYRRARAGRIR